MCPFPLLALTSFPSHSLSPEATPSLTSVACGLLQEKRMAGCYRWGGAALVQYRGRKNRLRWFYSPIVLDIFPLGF